MDNFIWEESMYESGFSQIPAGIFSTGPSAWAINAHRVDVAAIGNNGLVYVNSWQQ
jgi:hypothetical protein